MWIVPFSWGFQIVSLPLINFFSKLAVSIVLIRPQFPLSMKDSCEITLDIIGYFDERKRHAAKVNVACGLDIEMTVTLQLHYAPKSPHRNITCQSKTLLKPPLIFDCEEM